MINMIKHDGNDNNDILGNMVSIVIKINMTQMINNKQ